MLAAESMHALAIQPRQSFPFTQKKDLNPVQGALSRRLHSPWLSSTSDPTPSHVLQQDWRKAPSCHPSHLRCLETSLRAGGLRMQEMCPELCRDKPRTPGLAAAAWGGGGCAMARALLLPSFHSRICLAAFQLLGDTVAVAAAAAARRRLTNKLPIDADLYQSWYQRFAARAEGAASAHTALGGCGAGGEHRAASGAQRQPQLPLFHSLPL